MYLEQRAMEVDHFSTDFSCQESPAFLASNSELVDENTSHNTIDVYHDPALQEEHVRVLLDKEIDFGFRKDDQGFFKWTELRDDRSDAITWILRNRAVYGFRLRTAFLSILYFDQFISKRSFKGHKTTWLRTLSVACLSLAAKMEEQRSPLLSEYEVEDCIIERKWISEMELAVLSTLEWKMDPITPFAFIDYFITKMQFNKAYPAETKYDVIEGFLLYLTRMINLIQHRPSGLAAAATIMAYDHQLTRAGLETKINSFPNLRFLEIEDVCSIYEILQNKEDNGKSTRLPEFTPADWSLESDSARETVTS
ncbi:cyclin-D5-2-like [Argentina anserina]|uniref:cyclin-D5-2-like n=1 Tax=Argentina anserina TaxID=57926 RepID=UPI0021763EEA|nr:cyclin-D5-2-like [Potentilla anserina]